MKVSENGWSPEVQGYLVVCRGTLGIGSRTLCLGCTMLPPTMENHNWKAFLGLGSRENRLENEMETEIT